MILRRIRGNNQVFFSLLQSCLSFLIMRLSLSVGIIFRGTQLLPEMKRLPQQGAQNLLFQIQALFSADFGQILWQWDLPVTKALPVLKDRHHQPGSPGIPVLERIVNIILYHNCPITVGIHRCQQGIPHAVNSFCILLPVPDLAEDKIHISPGRFFHVPGIHTRDLNIHIGIHRIGSAPAGIPFPCPQSAQPRCRISGAGSLHISACLVDPFHQFLQHLRRIFLPL